MVRAAMTESVQFELRGSAAVLRLARPEVHNAVNRAVISRLEECLEELDEHPEVTGLVLTGAGTRSFCAGSDLDELASMEEPGPQDAEAVLRMEGILDRLASGPQVSVAALNGSAFGGGCELMSACHLRIASASARFSLRQTAMGLTPGWGGGARLFRRLGRSAALRLFLTADTIDAEEAHRLGLVDLLVPPEDVLPESLRLIERISANGPEAIRGILALAEAMETESPQEIRAVERRLFTDSFGNDHFRGRLESWRARRRP